MKPSSATPYFPEGVFGVVPGQPSPLAAHVESVLSALHEPPLYQREEKPPLCAYRFTWLGSFHPAIVVTLAFGPHLPAHFAVRSLTQDSFLPQFPHADSKDRAVDDEIVEALVQAFRRVEFLKIPAYDPRRGLCLDGAMWIIEAAEPGVYHAVYRHSPDDGPVRELGLEFLRIAHLEDEAIY